MIALFQPLTLKDVTYRNRIAVSPMCQYSSEDGHPTDWHFVHLGSRAVGGAGLVMVEATAVTPEGRISPGDSGIYTDGHVEGFARIARFMKQHGAVAGIQLAHAGRKASASRPWEGDRHLANDEGGWDIVAPSAEAFGGALTKVPKALSVPEIHQLTEQFVTAAKRALAAGFETLQLHFAHGYLAHSFYSPLSNHRTDEYGGSFANRSRFLLEILKAVRKVWPERLPLMARLSVSDWIEGGITVDESIELARQFRQEGLDLLDVSHGFVTPDISHVPWSPGFMAPIAERIRREAGIPVAVGWMITEPQQANEIIESQQADMVLLAREMLRDPYWPAHAAKALGMEHPYQVLPVPYSSPLWKRG